MYPEMQGEPSETLIQALLHRNPVQRLGCGDGGWLDIKRHAWFESIDWDGLYRRTLRAPWEPSEKSHLGEGQGRGTPPTHVAGGKVNRLSSVLAAPHFDTYDDIDVTVLPYVPRPGRVDVFVDF